MPENTVPSGADVSGLLAKNQELLAEVKAIRARLRASEGVTPEALAHVEADRDAVKASFAILTAESKLLSAEREKVTKELADERAAFADAAIGRAMVEALTAAGVTNPAHAKAAAALLRTGAVLGQDRAPMIGDKPLAEVVKAWAGGEEGKHFVAAPLNIGGGAPGGVAHSIEVDLMKLSPQARIDAARGVKS